jgi:type I restriction enzyme, S subunit
MTPDGWLAVRFADVADYKAGRTPARARVDYWRHDADTVPWVAIGDMTEFGIVRETRDRITQAAFREVFRGHSVPAGTLLMSFKLTIGRVATLGVDACHNEAIISIHPKPGVDQRFLGYFLSQVDYDALQDRQVKGNTLNQDKIDRIDIWLPPLNEQCQIAGALDLVQRAILVLEDGLGTARALKRAAMQALFTRGLRGEVLKESEIGEVPDSWDVVPLGKVSSLSTGTTPSTKRADYYVGDIPFIKTAQIVNNRLRSATTFVSDEAIRDYNLRVYPPGTVLMAMYGQGKTRGQVALLELPATTSQNAAAIQPMEVLNPAFLWNFFLSKYDELRGMGSLGHLSHLNLGYLRDLLVPLPPSLDEQREIVRILDAIDHKVELSRRKRGVLGELFKALLRKLMTGEIRVADLDLSAITTNSTPVAAA